MNSSSVSPHSYFSYPALGGFMWGHIVLMTIAWVFVLPIGIMLNVARSRLALPAQLSFLMLHSIGLLMGTVYSSKAPDLYENNAHNKIGWIVTWIVVAQYIIGLVKSAAIVKDPQDIDAEEKTAFLPISTEALAQQQEATYSLDEYRYSRDSGHFTASEASRSQSISSVQDHEVEEHQKLLKHQTPHADTDPEYTEKQDLLSNTKAQRIASTTRALNVTYDAIDCVSLLLGFAAIVSGAVVYGGVFRGDNVFNGLAHTVKGGIFFWYGLLTLGRWMGCFSEMGWAWNVRPAVEVISRRKAAMPSAEFVESFVIFLYGASNVFLEHLAAWGHAWSAQDLEHVSITIMFFGGGLCGMLVESTRIRDLLNTAILYSPAAKSNKELSSAPKTYSFSMNPFPGLIILLLGLMMSSHHQASMVSTMIHKQWGTLFVGFALARAVTYILQYVTPPSSYLPSRPPSEIVSSFCLISGGLMFMASNKDTVAAMEKYNLNAMFVLTVTIGFTSLLMAWAIIALAVKGWAARRGQVSQMYGFSTGDA
ncbi:MAG: hypothetical protein ASARMPRED_003196 [Alectoria sarmentosa]|nr:MAG: hypothetical protein ASARMPRED_003196 [Alectoria sarmentosa]